MNRFPTLKEIVSVYAVINFLTIAWAVVSYIWLLPAWLYFVSAKELLLILSYLFAQTTLESIFFLGVLLAFCSVLPTRFLRNAFVVQASWISIGFLGCIFIIIYWYTTEKPEGEFIMGISFVVSFVVTLFMAFLSTRVKALASFALWLSESLILFLYFLIPVSLLSIAVVLVRNLF